MTNKAKLEAILAFLGKKGWNNYGDWEIASDEGFWKIRFADTPEWENGYNVYTFNDLLASHSMWACLVGEKEVCRICGYIDIDERGTCQNCHNYNDLLPANLYHISQCFQLPEGQRLKYAAQFVEEK